jgi:NAD(P)-dependent dehydrogenase (short-subunit alcohol dehydrogenase family)
MRSVLITGSGRRLGSELAKHFAAENYNVILHAHSSLEQAETLCRDLVAKGCSVSFVQADLADPEPGSVAKFFGNIASRFGAPDVLVNNASAFRYDEPGSIDERFLHISLQLHAIAPAILIDLAYRTKSADQQITVFNILDQKLENLNPDFYSYTIGKSAAYAMTKLWQLRRPEGFRVFGLLPGLMYPSGEQSEERFAEDARKNPLQSTITSSDLFEAMKFFLQNVNLPGQNLAIDGGESLTRRFRDVQFE